jgi:hypothetical protein
MREPGRVLPSCRTRRTSDRPAHDVRYTGLLMCWSLATGWPPLPPSWLSNRRPPGGKRSWAPQARQTAPLQAAPFRPMLSKSAAETDEHAQTPLARQSAQRSALGPLGAVGPLLHKDVPSTGKPRRPRARPVRTHRARGPEPSPSWMPRFARLRGPTHGWPTSALAGWRPVSR